VALAALLALAGGAAGALARSDAPAIVAAYVQPQRAALHAGIEARGDVALQAAYAARDYRPIWLGDEVGRRAAAELLNALADATADGLDPTRYGATSLRTALAGADDATPQAQADLDLNLSAAFATYVGDLRRPHGDVGPAFVDPALAPPPRGKLLRTLATAAETGASVAQALRMNPLYEEVRGAYARGDAQTRRMLRPDLERLRLLPPDLGRRYVLVDITAERLSMIEDGQVQDEMRVVVGKPAMPTPSISGMIRYGVYNPYWNVPPDLARLTYAPRALKDPAALRGMEILSDWSDQAATLDAAAVDWQAVADGRSQPRLRQLPGAGNMMGAVKFMLPNTLGIYLHDTPDKTAFERERRNLSAGCVRLEDAARLGRWLYGREVAAQGDAPEQRIELPQPTPVYIVYLTARTAAGKIERRPDVYRRDSALLASLAVKSEQAF
jgi:murein L,D-transpeptidase YcbB/YkuD